MSNDDLDVHELRYHYSKAIARPHARSVTLTAELTESRRRFERKANGHVYNCVCRTCFEEWLATQ